MKQEDVAKALDCLYGACDVFYDIVADVVDHKDSRLELISEALAKARDAIEAIQDEK